MWHKQTEGFYPPTERDSVWYYNDVSLAVYSINPGVILFMNDTLFYSLSTDSTMNFYGAPSNPYAFTSFTFQYNYITNKMIFNLDYYVGAGAGEWTDAYTSF